jgi:hypothetical protein
MWIRNSTGANVLNPRLQRQVTKQRRDNRSRSRQAERDELIVDMYRAGMPVAEIARCASVCVKTVRNIARRAGIPPRNPPQVARDAEAVARYRAGEPVHGIAAALDTSRSRVRHVAARAGLRPRSGWQRLYPIDEGAFDCPTEVGWWLIGLLAADGSIHAAENRVALCQKLDDADVLHALYSYVGCPDRPLTMLNLSEAARARQLPRRPAAEARVFSSRIVKALARHGVVERKTASLELSPEASRRAAVWLGVLDGDGSVGVYRYGRQPVVSFFGTRRLMEQCEEFWRNSLGFSEGQPAARPHRAGIWTFRLCNSKAGAAARILLASSSTSMARKRELLLEIAQWTARGVLCENRNAPKVPA